MTCACFETNVKKCIIQKYLRFVTELDSFQPNLQCNLLLSEESRILIVCLILSYVDISNQIVLIADFLLIPPLPSNTSSTLSLSLSSLSPTHIPEKTTSILIANQQDANPIKQATYTPALSLSNNNLHPPDVKDVLHTIAH